MCLLSCFDNAVHNVFFSAALVLLQEDLLHEAASRGDADVLEALLAAAPQAALGRTDGRGLGRTPLHSAVLHCQAAAAQLLVEEHLRRLQERRHGTSDSAAAAASAAGAGGLDAADSQGYTALHMAAMKGMTGTPALSATVPECWGPAAGHPAALRSGLA